MLYRCHSAPAQHMLQLKVRDVQSKMPEINTSRLFGCCNLGSHLHRGNATVCVGDASVCVRASVYTVTNSFKIKIFIFPHSTGIK